MPAPRPHRRRMALALAGLGLAVACSGDARPRAALDDYRGTMLSAPLAKADFTLTDTDGEPYRFRERTDGHLTLLFFGYTNCPDVCPVHMANLGAVLNRFPFEMRADVRVVFVSTDPDRDSAARIREWLDSFSTDFVGLRGDSADVAHIQQSFALAPAVRSTVKEDGSYDVGHAAQIIAFTSDDQAHVVYPFGTRQEDWLHDLPLLLNWE